MRQCRSQCAAQRRRLALHGPASVSSGRTCSRTAHRFLDEGSYTIETCVTDDDGGAGCGPFLLQVTNLTPTVEAGPDRHVNAFARLTDAHYDDPGVTDVHTATVDWGDGVTETATILSPSLGTGQVAASHTYTADGVYTAEVCVADDGGATGCDSVVFTATVTAYAPELQTRAGESYLEGEAVAATLLFTDTNPADSYTATVRWGDGSATSPSLLQSQNGYGVALAEHVYGDDGAFDVEGELCDGAFCVKSETAVTIRNASPVVSATGIATTTTEVEIHVLFDDPGFLDTHTATIDWNDGSPVESFAVSAGTPFVISHSYGDDAPASVLICVEDDDGGEGCASVALGIESQRWLYLPLIWRADGVP